jgi:hypothetical protein
MAVLDGWRVSLSIHQDIIISHSIRKYEELVGSQITELLTANDFYKCPPHPGLILACLRSEKRAPLVVSVQVDEVMKQSHSQ